VHQVGAPPCLATCGDQGRLIPACSGPSRCGRQTQRRQTAGRRPATGRGATVRATRVNLQAEGHRVAELSSGSASIQTGREMMLVQLYERHGRLAKEARDRESIGLASRREPELLATFAQMLSSTTTIGTPSAVSIARSGETQVDCCRAAGGDNAGEARAKQEQAVQLHREPGAREPAAGPSVAEGSRWAMACSKNWAKCGGGSCCAIWEEQVRVPRWQRLIPIAACSIDER